MSQLKKIQPIKESWTRCEEVIHAIGMHQSDDIKFKIGNKTFDNIIEFLNNISFLNGICFTSTGSDYFQEKYILNNEEKANSILKESIINYEPTQAISQIMWGRPSLKRINVYKLLVFQEYIDQQTYKEEDLGSYLMLLNQCNILKYSKKTNDVTLIYNPRTSPKSETTAKFLSPETPYSNLRNLWDVLRSCSQYIHWVDKHFSSKGLEPLHDEADGTKQKEIKILTSTMGGANEKLHRDFERFKDELKIRNINCELRVLCDKGLISSIHDRWIISEKLCYNIPPVNSMFMGQYSELKLTSNRPPFIDWWNQGKDILLNWDEISKQINNP